MALTDPRPPARTVLVGGVAELYQGDLDFGRLIVERLSGAAIHPQVVVEELSYGAVAVVQRLQDLRPAALLLVGACARGREPGTLHRRRIDPPAMESAEVGRAVAEAVTGYVSIDLLVEVAHGLAALPRRTVAIELEPVRTEVSEQLSAEAEAALAPALEMVRAEIRRVTEELGSPQPQGAEPPFGSGSGAGSSSSPRF